MDYKEKAKELVDKFYDKIEDFPVQCTQHCYGGSIERMPLAKQCAIILCDEVMGAIPKCTDKNEQRIIEMMDAINDIPSDDDGKYEAQLEADMIAQKLRLTDEYKYWQSIKTELKPL